jgi:hypothetical protein
MNRLFARKMQENERKKEKMPKIIWIFSDSELNKHQHPHIRFKCFNS